MRTVQIKITEDYTDRMVLSLDTDSGKVTAKAQGASDALLAEAFNTLERFRTLCKLEAAQPVELADNGDLDALTGHGRC